LKLLVRFSMARVVEVCISDLLVSLGYLPSVIRYANLVEMSTE